MKVPPKKRSHGIQHQVIVGTVGCLFLVAAGLGLHWHPEYIPLCDWIVVAVATIGAYQQRAQHIDTADTAFAPTALDGVAPGVVRLLVEQGREIIRAQVAEGDSQTIRAAGFLTAQAAGLGLLLANRHSVSAWEPICVALFLSSLGMASALFRGEFSSAASLRTLLGRKLTDPDEVAAAILGEFAEAEPLNERVIQTRQGNVQFGTTLLFVAMVATAVWLIGVL
ncbi:MAG: hypothetical protein ACYDD0_08960 [Candidatus Dormibacteria bacterium]